MASAAGPVGHGETTTLAQGGWRGRGGPGEVAGDRLQAAMGTGQGGSRPSLAPGAVLLSQAQQLLDTERRPLR